MALSVSSTDWSPTSADWARSDWSARSEALDNQWERFGENSEGHNDSKANTSSSDWSQNPSVLKDSDNHRWKNWEPEEADSHPSHPERGENHNLFINSMPTTPSPDWSPQSSEHKCYHQQRDWETGGSDKDSHLSHLKGDDDYIDPKTSRPGPGPFSREILTPSLNQNTQRIAPYLINPKKWVPAYTEVDTIKPGHIVSVAVLDFFLSLESHQSQLSTNFRERFYYLSQDAIHILTASGELEDVQGVLKQSLSIIDENTVSCPFLFLVTPRTAPTTYFLVLFDFRENIALILGRLGLSGPEFHKAYGEWESWKGHILWKKIQTVLIRPGFEELEREPSVYNTDLIPPNSHSGPGISGFVQLLRDEKWDWQQFISSATMPEVSCDHNSREQMFYTIIQGAYECFKLWKVVSQSDNGWDQPPKDILDEMHAQPARLQWIKNISVIFFNQRSKCKKCYLRAEGSSDDLPLRGRKKRDISPSTPQREKLHYPDPLPLDMEVVENESTQEPTPNRSFINFDDYGSAPLYRQRSPPVLNTWTFNSSGSLVIPSWAPSWKDEGYRLPPDFDCISSKKSPTDYTSRLFPVEPLETSSTPDANNNTDTDHSSLDSRRKDPTGYISPLSVGSSETSSAASEDNTSSASEENTSVHGCSFPDSRRKDPTDYASPLSVESSKASSEANTSIHAGSFPDSRRKPINMSAAEMLKEAGTMLKTKESYNVFVRGKTRGDEFIKLDIEKDHLPLAQEEIDISVDIDSVIWVTRGQAFSCRGAINLHLKPHYSSLLPFSANPSVYITLMEPPHDEGELKHPQSRSRTRFPLSSIPHMPFGYFGEATQQFNLYVFFPRMVHKNNNNNRAITIMPQELRELWLSEAVFKALADCMDCYAGTSEYLPHSTDQLKWKAGGLGRQPTIPVSPSAISSLLAKIRSLLKNNEDLLSRFGSFFFVLDARGIKMLTKQHISEKNAFQTLQTLVPSLDWVHMMDRKNGELYLDLGVSFHPINTSEPMVGLWRLSSLRSSYSLMGHSKKNFKEFHHNTMQDYGGMKAQTSDKIREHTHISKRISYNLHFEAVRHPGQQDYISTLGDAIRCNQKYVEGCQRWVKVLEEGEKHSYGVRDELRASAHVVNELLPKVMKRAETFLKSNPIAWIPAKTFFRFSSRRFIELHELHCKLALIRPENYGTLSAFILHLMQSVMVTPSSIPPYVQSALRMLHESRVMERFGMFFVDDLDLDDMDCINVNLGEQDGNEIKQVQKAALATRLPPKKGQDRGIQLTESHRTTDYPWGETILWSTVQRLLKEHPVDFLRPFKFRQLETGLEDFLLIEFLFNQFTKEAWLGFHESFVPAGVRPCSTRLKDCMEVWTCQNIVARLCGKCKFLPSNYGLEGAPTSKGSDLSFKALRPLFFPAPGQSFRDNTIWACYSEPSGYIGRYWEILKEFEDDRDKIDALHNGIDEVFEQLQCLPQIKPGSSLWHATGGSVCFLTNPHYYRIRAVSSTARKLIVGPQRPQVNAAELRKRLDPYSHASSKRKRSLHQRKSTSLKQKKYRRPPNKRQRMDKTINAQTIATVTARRTMINVRHGVVQGKNSVSENMDSSSSENDSNSCRVYSEYSTMSSESRE